MKNRACSILIGFNRTFEEHWVLAKHRGKKKTLKLFFEVYILKVLSVFLYIYCDWHPCESVSIQCKGRAKVIGPSCYVALNYTGNFIAHLLPSTSPSCLTILCFSDIKDRSETQGNSFQLQIELDIMHWQCLAIWLVHWMLSDCAVTRMHTKKKSLWCKICRSVIPIIHWQVLITINNK